MATWWFCQFLDLILNLNRSVSPLPSSDVPTQDVVKVVVVSVLDLSWLSLSAAMASVWLYMPESDGMLGAALL